MGVSYCYSYGVFSIGVCCMLLEYSIGVCYGGYSIGVECSIGVSYRSMLLECSIGVFYIGVFYWGIFYRSMLFGYGGMGERRSPMGTSI